MHAVDGLAELLRRRVSWNARGQWIVINLIQRNSVCSPTALERPGIGIVDDHAFIQVSVRDVQLVRRFVQFCRGDSAQEQTSLLVILLLLVLLLHGGAAMAKLGNELPV